MKFHQDSKDLRLKENKPCALINTYETSPYVVWKGVILGAINAAIGKLSELKPKYLAALREQIHKIFPERQNGCSLMDVKVFDHRTFRDFTPADRKAMFRRACTYLGHPQIQSTFVTEYSRLVDKIKTDPDQLSDNVRSSPQLAWAVYLKNNIVTPTLKQIILTATSVPMGTAQGKTEFFWLETNELTSLFHLQLRGPSHSSTF